MSNIVWMSDVRNTLTIDGVEYIFQVVTTIWILLFA